MSVDDVDWARWRPDGHATLVYVVRNGRILLIDKKRGLGAGRLNAPGGKVDPGETPRQAAIREFREEVMADPRGLAKIGDVFFHVTGSSATHIHVFRADGCDGRPRETPEAVPHWFAIDNIPYDRMWEDDRHWLPLLIRGEAFTVYTVFDGDRMLGHRVERGTREP